MYKDFLGEGRMWLTMTAIMIIMMILLLHIIFWTMSGPAFSWMMSMIPILRDFNHIIRPKIHYKLATQFFKVKNWQSTWESTCTSTFLITFTQT